MILFLCVVVPFLAKILWPKATLGRKRTYLTYIPKSVPHWANEGRNLGSLEQKPQGNGVARPLSVSHLASQGHLCRDCAAHCELDLPIGVNSQGSPLWSGQSLKWHSLLMRLSPVSGWQLKLARTEHITQHSSVCHHWRVVPSICKSYFTTFLGLLSYHQVPAMRWLLLPVFRKQNWNDFCYWESPVVLLSIFSIR